MPLLYISLLMAGAKYLFQFTLFSPFKGPGGTASPVHYWYTGGSLAAEWFGLYRIDAPAVTPPPATPPPVTYTSLWQLLAPHLWVAAVCVLQRWSHDFGARVAREEHQDKVRSRWGTGRRGALATCPAPCPS